MRTGFCCWGAILLLWCPVTAAQDNWPVNDAFARHTGEQLVRLAKGLQGLESLSARQAQRWPRLGPNVEGPTLIVKTDRGNWAKVELDWGYRRAGGRLVPVVMIQRFVTYRATALHRVEARARQRMLFPGFYFDLDLGQVVPEDLGGDLYLDASGRLKPSGGAVLFAWQRGLRLPRRASGPRPWDHPEVRPQDFQGTWQLDADGRLRGRLVLEVDARGNATGHFISDRTGTRFEVFGKVQPATPHRLRLVVKLANSEQSFDLYLWSTHKSTMAGTTQLGTQRYGAVARRLLPKPPAVQSPATRSSAVR